MPFTTFRGEKTVGEIADKVYASLTPKQRDKAEAALLKANPQLKDMPTLRAGAILRVPNLPELRVKTTRDLEHPAAQVAKTVTDALNTYRTRLVARREAEVKAVEAQRALLGDARFKKQLIDAPKLQALADAAGKALATRSKLVDERLKSADRAIEQALDDLQTRTGIKT